MLRSMGASMHLNLYIVIGAAVVGLLVGVTGAGGGALMTPMLILIFGVNPVAAISSDLVASVVMRPVGAAVHLRAGTVHRGLVGLLAASSVPAAIAGAYLLSAVGSGASGADLAKHLLGVALLAGAAAMAFRHLLDARKRGAGRAPLHALKPRPLPTVLIGALGGLVVGMTSVGAGSLMIVLLLFAYPTISPKQLVGTDLVQAVPLTLAAALGALLFGHVHFVLTASLVIGSVPGVLAGSLISSRVSDRLIRPLIALVILVSGLKYVGVGSGVLLVAAAIASVLLGGVLLPSRLAVLRGAGSAFSSSGLE